MSYANNLDPLDNDITDPPAPMLTRKEIAFVDTGVADWQSLVAGIRPGVEVVLLDGSRDGLAQMAEWARSHTGYDAIHVLSHGSEGSLRLGQGTVTSASLADAGVQAELAQLGQSLTADGDLLIYGCSVAAGEAGQAFVANLAAATGADVAASDGPTGASWLGGDWVLEKTNGIIEAENGLMETGTGFAGILADTNLDATPSSLTATGSADVFAVQASTYNMSSDGGSEPGYDFNFAPENTYYTISGFDTGADKISVVSWGKTNGEVTITIENGSTVSYSDFINRWGFEIYVSPGYITAAGFTSPGGGAIPAGAVVTDAANNPVSGDTTGTLIFLTDATDWYLRAIFLPDVTSTSLTSDNFIIEAPTGPAAPGTPDMTSGTDSGTNTDNITNDSTPTYTISGSTNNSTTVTLFNDANGNGAVDSGESLGTAAGNGAAVTITASTLADGTYNIKSIQTDASGTSTASSALSVTIDTTAPSAPSTPDMTDGTDSGSSNTDNITNDTTPTFTGTAEAGSTVTLYDTDGTTSLGSATATGGNWTITASTLSAGAHTLTAKAADAAGNVSVASGGLSATIDATAPSAPGTPDMTAGTDSGTSDSDNTTSDTTPDFTGTAEAGSTVTLYDTDGTTSLGSATATGGNWSITASTLSAGAHTLTAKAADAAGNVSSASSGLSVTIDTAGSAITFSALSFSADTGSSGSDFITKTAAQTIGATLSGSLSGGDIVYGSLDNGGNWTDITSKVSGTTLTWDGVTLSASNTLKLKVTDSAGNDGTIASQAYTLDTGAPSISAVSIPNSAMKVGDTVTATITVADDGGVTYTLGSSTIGGFTLGGLARTNSTTYTASFTVTEGGTDVAAGSNIPVSVVLTDNAGNSNSAYTTAISQAGDAINARSPTDIALSNNSVATIGGANAVVGALTSTDATSGETFTYSLEAGDGSTNNGLFNISGGDLRANNASTLTAGNSYNVRVRTTDAAGNFYEEAFTVNAVVGPAIASATYNVATGVLTVTGSLMEANGGGMDIAVNKLTLTGEGGETYLLTSGDVEITSATEFSVTLNATDQAALSQILNKNGSASTDATPFNLAAADDWNTNVTTGDTADATNAVTVSNVAVPAITSAAYDYSTNTLVVTGTGFLKKSGATNDIDISKLTFTGEGGATYTLTSASDVEITSATSFSVTLSGADLTQVEALLSANGASAASGTPYNLAAAEDWAAGAAAAVNVVDATGNGITVSNWAAPTVTSAAYDWTTGQLVLTGTNFVNAGGPTNDLVASLLTLSGEGGSYTLTDSANVEITSATSATVALSAADQLNVHGLLNKNGTTSSGAVTYNLAAADNWMAGSPAASDIADLTGNGITVSNVATPTITSATYDSDSGVLSVIGTNLFKKVGATNDVDISTLTFTGGTANATYTLTSASDVEITSATSFSVTLSGADKTSVDALLDQLGTTSSGGSTYNLAGAEDWLAGADAAVNIADASNAVTVSIAPKITSATYNAATGVLVVTGANIQANGGGADIDASKLTLTGEGGATYTLTDTSDVERDSATQFTLTLSATDKAALNQIVNQDGTASSGTTTYNLAGADDWNTQVTTGDTADATNAVTASNVAAPVITSATYNAASGALVVTGTGFLKKSGATNDIDVSKLTIAGEGGETRTLTTSSVEITSGTVFTVTLNAADLAVVNQILNQTGTSATGGATYNLAAAEDWAAGAAAAVNVADLTGNGITVSNPTTPAITSATYNATTGVLSVTGTGFLKRDGATNDIVANKFTITGEAGGTYTLTDSADVEITSGTAFTLTLSATDKTAVNALVNKAGTASTDNTTYNLAAAEDWAAGAAAAVNVADLAGNGITATLSDGGGGGGGGGTPPPPPSTTVDGATVTTGTTTTDDGRVLDVVTIAPVTSNRVDTVNDATTGEGTVERADIALYYSDSGMDVPATTASLPVGVGLTSTGARTPATNAEALANLITLIDQTGGTTEANEPNMISGGESFLARLDAAADRGPLIVNSITLTAASGAATAPGQPITISGTANRVTQTGNGNGGAPVEAIVIDTRQLPAGSVLELENIEFAVIVGNNVTVRGGQGANIVFAGAGSQNIVLGEDDDELYGGDGDDVVGSKAGNDKLYGDAGNDRVTGGVGDDEINGGDGNDILQGGASDAGSWTFALNSQGRMVARFTPADSYLADFSGATFSGAWTRTTPERGQFDSRFGLIEQDYRTLEDIALLFNALTGQLPSARALDDIAGAYPSAHGLAQAAYDYFAANLRPSLTQTNTVEAHMRALITRVWGSASDDMVAIGSQYIHGGGNWADGLLYLARHANNRNDLLDTDGTLRLCTTMTLDETGWSASSGNDRLYGGAGNDWLVGGNGANLLDGGDGIDMVGLVGALADYTLRQQLTDGVVEIVLTSVQGGDTHRLRNVELLKLGNEIYAALNVLPSGAVAVSADRPLADFVRLVGTAELQSFGVPEGWGG